MLGNDPLLLRRYEMQLRNDEGQPHGCVRGRDEVVMAGWGILGARVSHKHEIGSSILPPVPNS